MAEILGFSLPSFLASARTTTMFLVSVWCLFRRRQMDRRSTTLPSQNPMFMHRVLAYLASLPRERVPTVCLFFCFVSLPRPSFPLCASSACVFIFPVAPVVFPNPRAGEYRAGEARGRRKMRCRCDQYPPPKISEFILRVESRSN